MYSQVPCLNSKIFGSPWKRGGQNGETKVISVANQKGEVSKSTTVNNLGAGLLLDVDPQGDLTKMLGQCEPHDLPLTLTNVMNDVVSGASLRDHSEIMHHHEGFDFILDNRSLSAVEVELVNVMSWETVLRQYVDSVKRDYNYVPRWVCWSSTSCPRRIMFLFPSRRTIWRRRV